MLRGILLLTLLIGGGIIIERVEGESKQTVTVNEEQYQSPNSMDYRLWHGIFIGGLSLLLFQREISEGIRQVKLNFKTWEKK